MASYTPVLISEGATASPEQTVVQERTYSPSSANPAAPPGADNSSSEAKVETPATASNKPEGNVEAAKADGEPAKEPEGDLAARNRIARAQRAAKREVEALRAEKEAAARELAEWKAWQDKVRNDPRALLEKAGIDLDTLILAHINDGKLPPEKAQQQKLNEIEKKLAAIEEAKQQEQQQAQQAHVRTQVNGYIGEMKAKIDSDKDAFEFCSINGDQALKDAWELSEAYFKETGAVPDPASVVEQLEKMYEEEAFERATKSKKLAAKLAPKVAEQKPAAPAPKKPAPVVGSSATQAVPAPKGKVTDWAEYERQAIADWRRQHGRSA